MNEQKAELTASITGSSPLAEAKLTIACLGVSVE